MYPTTLLLATAIAALSPAVLAVPAPAPVDNVATAAVEKRADYDAPDGGDVTILNYALTLEYLERKFYFEGLQNYSQKAFSRAGFGDGFYGDLLEIFADEESHVTFLAGALGDSAVLEPTFSFPATTPAEFLALSSVLEGVGVSAYLGAAGAIVDKAYLGAAGSILTVEARHSSYIRKALGRSPFPKPYDTPLDFMAVYSLAAQFITGFPRYSKTLPFKAFPALVVEAAGAGRSDGTYAAGSDGVVFSGAFANALTAGLVEVETPVYAVFYSGQDTYYVPTSVVGNYDVKVSRIPGKGYATADQLAPMGQVYVVLSTADGSAATASDENIMSGVGIIEVVA